MKSLVSLCHDIKVESCASYLLLKNINFQYTRPLFCFFRCTIFCCRICSKNRWGNFFDLLYWSHFIFFYIILLHFTLFYFNALYFLLFYFYFLTLFLFMYTWFFFFVFKVAILRTFSVQKKLQFQSNHILQK